MDEYTASIFVNDDISTASNADTTDTVNPSDQEDNAPSDVEPQTPPTKGLRGRVAALRDKAGVQDRLLEKYECHFPCMPSPNSVLAALHSSD